MSPKKIGLAVAAVAALGAGAVAGASLASAAGNDPTTSAYGEGQRGPGEGGRGPGGGSHDTPVTGAELTKVKDAVKAKDSSVSVQSVRQDPDGSYDVFGTKDGSPVMLEVSKDLKTITENTGGHRGGHGGPGGPGGPGGGSHTPVTGAELTKVKDAVKAKDSSVSVQSVRQDPDGSYDVLGTKDGSPVMLEVSKDLKTITERTGGHGGGPGDHGGPPAPGGTSEQPSSYVPS